MPGWTDEQIERFSEVSESDREDARVQWRQDVPRRWRDLLDAEPLEPEHPLTDG